MITLPIALTYKDISVYPDTNDCNLFYCIRSVPHVRTNESGKPVFTGSFWSGSKASDETSRGFKGGRINFDTNLAITEREEEFIKSLIEARNIQKKRYDEIVAREQKRENLIKAVSAPSKKSEDKDISNSFLEGEIESARTKIPEVGEISFGTPTFTSGSVDLCEQNGGTLVEWHNGGGKPALFGDNNRATALQLTPDGAAVFHHGITTRSQAISIVYDMKLQMAMPALDIRIYAGSIQEASIQRLVKHVDKKCSGKEVNARAISELLTDMGFINIEVDRKSTTIDDDTVDKIRESMMKIVEKKVEEIISTKIATLTPEERDGKTNLTIEEELRSFTELNFTESSVFEFNIAPQATICDFFENVSDEHLQNMVNVIDMTDEVFSFKEITLCALAPWTEKPFVNVVKVECEYSSLPEGHKDRIKSFMFDKDTPTAEWSFMKPQNDDGTIKYTPYVYLNGSSDCIKLPTQTATGNYVIINIGKIGIIDVGFQAHPNVANLPGDLKVSGIQVELWYDDSKGNRLMGPEQILISDLNAVTKFERNLGVILDQPLHYKTTYIFKNSDPISLAEKTFYLADGGVSTIYAEFPFKNRKIIQVELPSVPSENVKEITGEIYFGKYTFPISMSKEDDWEAVKVNLCTLDENTKDYTYKFYLKYQNNEYDMVTSGIMSGNIDSSTLMIPLRRIEMAGIDLLSLGEDYYRANIQVDLPTGLGNPIEFHLSKKDKDLESKIFYIFCPSDAKLEINWKLSLYNFEGQEMPTVTGKTDKSFFILTPHKKESK